MTCGCFETVDLAQQTPDCSRGPKGARSAHHRAGAARLARLCRTARASCVSRASGAPSPGSCRPRRFPPRLFVGASPPPIDQFLSRGSRDTTHVPRPLPVGRRHPRPGYLPEALWQAGKKGPWEGRMGLSGKELRPVQAPANAWQAGRRVGGRPLARPFCPWRKGAVGAVGMACSLPAHGVRLRIPPGYSTPRRNAPPARHSPHSQRPQAPVLPTLRGPPWAPPLRRPMRGGKRVPRVRRGGFVPRRGGFGDQGRSPQPLGAATVREQGVTPRSLTVAAPTNIGETLRCETEFSARSSCCWPAPPPCGPRATFLTPPIPAWAAPPGVHPRPARRPTPLTTLPPRPPGRGTSRRCRRRPRRRCTGRRRECTGPRSSRSSPRPRRPDLRRRRRPPPRRQRL
jgi:hypothetical protein